MLYLGALTVSRVNAWLAAAGHQDGPLFRRVRRGGRVGGDPGRRLSVNAIRRIIRSRAAAVGIEGRVSGHSLRVGGAQSLAAGGASIVEMQTAGRWQSPACRATMHGASWQHGAPSLRLPFPALLSMMMKRGFHGTYHRMFPKHLQRYVSEFAGRHNIHDCDTIDQIIATAAGLVGKRLQYRELIS